MLLLELSSMSNDKFLTGSTKLIKSSWKNLSPHKNPSSTSSIPWLCREKVPVLLLLSPITGICNLTPHLLLFGPNKKPEKPNSPKIQSNAWSQSTPWLALMEILSSKTIFDFSFCFRFDLSILLFSFLFISFIYLTSKTYKINCMVELLWECQILVDTLNDIKYHIDWARFRFQISFSFQGFWEFWPFGLNFLEKPWLWWWIGEWVFRGRWHNFLP